MILRDRPRMLSEEKFLSIYGGIYEHSPWIAQAAYTRQPALDLDTVEGLHQAMKEAVENADHAHKLALICAHPELACAPAVAETLSKESSLEQKGAGLKECTPEEFSEFQRLNAAYKDKFGFPFIIAVKGLNRTDILQNFRARVSNDLDTEFSTALTQIHKIAFLRLTALAEGPIL
ncbi:MAG: 2-oxo-4-hydroxy-4-carboxy-5-ureidoimidazoline decarboxylase [Alphaproteobacteria bacterium]|nr:2-oxo-4-hydroxy-4-carboxy-5-ureidoimidazoline decarboxylase [Alphaproteobacteria bacterium]